MRGAGQGAWLALALFTAANLLNYLDRFVVSAIVTSLEKSPAEGGLGLTGAQSGSLYSSFVIVYLLAAPAMGLLADRFRRKAVLAAGVALWSMVTAAGAFAGSFAHLLLLRALTGVGEAAYATVAPAVLGDCFPQSMRARAMGIFSAALPVGAALGFIVGGAMAGSEGGWRGAFLLAGLPGILLAGCFLFWREPPRGAMDPVAEAARPPGLGGMLAIALRERFGLPLLGYALQTAGFGALGFWTPTFLERAKGMSLDEATTMFGVVIAATGLVGTVVGGWVGDAWLRRNPAGLLWTSAVTSLVAAPFVAAVIMADGGWVLWGSMVVGCFLLVASTGPINAHLINQLSPVERASGMALSIVVIHLLGDVPSVPLVGSISDSHGQVAGFAFIPFAVLAGGLVWAWSALRVKRLGSAPWLA